MDSDPGRTRAIERRIARLERRLADLEAVVGTTGAPTPEPAAPPAAPPPAHGIGSRVARRPHRRRPPRGADGCRGRGAPPLPPGLPRLPAGRPPPRRSRPRAGPPRSRRPVPRPSAAHSPGTRARRVPGRGVTRGAPRCPRRRGVRCRSATSRSASPAARSRGWAASPSSRRRCSSSASAFSRGWITEPMRVVVGLGAGSASLAAGALLLARRNPLLGNVLCGVGLGVISVALLAATRLYGLVPPEVGLLAALAAAVAAAVIAVRFDARSVAAYGLVAALVAPPLVGAEPTLLTLLFVAVTLVGTTAVSLFRSWRWLPAAGLRPGRPAARRLAGRRPAARAGAGRAGGLLGDQHRRRGRRGGAHPARRPAPVERDPRAGELRVPAVGPPRRPRRPVRGPPRRRRRGGVRRPPPRRRVVPRPAGRRAPVREPRGRHGRRPARDRGVPPARCPRRPGRLGGRGHGPRLARGQAPPPLVGGRVARARRAGGRSPRPRRVPAVRRSTSRPR